MRHSAPLEGTKEEKKEMIVVYGNERRLNVN